MPHGGSRAGSGRKTNAQINNVRTILTDTITDDQWKTFFRRLHQYALKGNMRAAALLLNYRFGDPHADPEKAPAPDIHIHTIEAHLSDRRAPRRDPGAGPVPFVTIERDHDDHTHNDTDEDDSDEDIKDLPDEHVTLHVAPPNTKPDSIPAHIPYPRFRYFGEET